MKDLIVTVSDNAKFCVYLLMYVPSQLIGRKKEIIELARIFKSLDSKGYPSNALVLGYPDSGKTVVTKFLLQKLIERLESKK